MLIIEAVAYQFAKIGNEESLVQALGDDEVLGKYIDSMGTSSGDDNHQLFAHVSC